MDGETPISIASNVVWRPSAREAFTIGNLSLVSLLTAIDATIVVSMLPV